MSEPAIVSNLAQHTGTDRQFQFTVLRSDRVTPQDLTSWVAVSFIVYAYDDPNIVYVTKTVGSGVTFTDRTNGIITAAVDAADIANLRPGQYAWRLERTDSGSDFVVGIGLYSLLGK